MSVYFTFIINRYVILLLTMLVIWYPLIMWKNSLVNKIFKFNQLFFFWYYPVCIFIWLNGMCISNEPTKNRIITNIKTLYRSYATSCKPSEERKSARNNYYFTLMLSRVSDLSLPPLYWYVTSWEILGNTCTGQLRVTLRHEYIMIS
jgi:hypothetical protein